MASRIQGITVEIGGDTTKLSKALESVNKSIKGTQSGLKDVNKLLKLDPSNTELVVQKQKMLKDAIEATKEKLATLKTAAQQANEQLANGLTASDLGTRMYSIDVEEGSVVETYNTLANEIRKRMDDLRKERSMLENEQGELGNMKKNFW